MRLISSELALKLVVALSAAGEVSLSRLAESAGVRPSTAQRALAILGEDGLIERSAGTRPVYRLAESRLAALVARLAVSVLPIPEAVGIAARANRSIEFVALEGENMVAVFSSRLGALEQSRAARLLEALAEEHGLEVEYLDHDDVRRELLVDGSLRRRMARANLLAGDLEATFPDRSGHWRPAGHPLRRPHRSLQLPPRRRLLALAKKHRLGALKLFGSAVRSDFRPDSDLDVLVSYQPGTRPSLRSLRVLEQELEGELGRDVDLVREETLRDDVRARLEEEAVSLL